MASLLAGVAPNRLPPVAVISLVQRLIAYVLEWLLTWRRGPVLICRSCAEQIKGG